MDEILNTYIEKYGDENGVKINAYKEYLNQTDYVVIKMSEVMAEGGNIEAIKTEYSLILTNRETAREKINELEYTKTID